MQFKSAKNRIHQQKRTDKLYEVIQNDENKLRQTYYKLFTKY